MIAAIIVAAGKGLRMGTSRRKQFLPLGNRPILSRTLHVFDRCRIIDTIILVLPEAEIDFFWKDVLPGADLKRQPTVVAGGQCRQESVMNGLAVITDRDGLVLIHDGVRPLVSADLIESVADGARKWGACIPVLPASDTPKQVDGQGVIIKTHSRDWFRLAQTPQAFHLPIIRAAHEKAKCSGVAATDDASLVEALGKDVHTIHGERENIKITTAADLAVAETYLELLARPPETA